MLGNHRTGMRIPSSKGCARFDGRTVLYQQGGAIRYFVAFAFAADFVVNHDFGRTSDNDQLALIVCHITHLAVKAHRTVGFRFHVARCRRTGSRTTDVEGTHGQLGTRFADRLRRNDTDGFARIDQFTASQVTAVTFRTQAVTGFTGNRRADFHFIHTGVVDDVHQLFGQQGSGFHQCFVGRRINDILCGHASQNTVAQCFNHIAALYHGFHDEAV